MDTAIYHKTHFKTVIKKLLFDSTKLNIILDKNYIKKRKSFIYYIQNLYKVTLLAWKGSAKIQTSVNRGPDSKFILKAIIKALIS